MKYIVLKIAAGVFLGIVTALAAYKSFQIWEVNSMTQRYAEKQRLAEQQLAVRTAKAVYDLSDAKLNPDRLMALCGRPVRDSGAGSEQRGYYRRMDYVGADGLTVTLNFLCANNFCYATEMHRRDRTTYDYAHTPDYETNFIKPRVSQIEELPCLIGLAELK